MKIVAGEVEDASGETNMSAYLAVGVWHHWMLRRDLAFVERMWPVVRRGLDFVVGMQLPFGGIAWSQEWDDDGPARVNRDALLAGSSSIYQSLRAGVALADLMDEPQPEWELAGGRLGHALREHRDLFLDKSTFSMDWYYPVLGGAVRGQAGLDLIASRWDDFVVPDLGIRCVDTNPWVTGAETCELVMALDCLDDHERALRLYADMQHLRHENGSYWTGSVHPGVRLLAGRADDLHGRGGDPGRRRALPHHAGLRHHARRDAGRSTSARSRSSAGVPTTRQPTSSPAAPEVRVSTRIDPTVSAGVNAPPVDGALPDVERRLAAVLGTLEHVVDDQHAAGLHPAGEAGVVVLGVLLGVAAVDEQQRERRTPVRGDGGRAADDRDHLVLEPGAGDRPAEHRQRVHQPELVVDEARVVVLPAGLVLLRAAVVVEGEHGAARRPCRRPEPDRGLAAVAADLERRAVAPGGPAPCACRNAPSSSGMNPLAARACSSRSAGISADVSDPRWSSLSKRWLMA